MFQLAKQKQLKGIFGLPGQQKSSEKACQHGVTKRRGETEQLKGCFEIKQLKAIKLS
jgi:hypothetical protein